MEHPCQSLSLRSLKEYSCLSKFHHPVFVKMYFRISPFPIHLLLSFSHGRMVLFPSCSCNSVIARVLLNLIPRANTFIALPLTSSQILAIFVKYLSKAIMVFGLLLEWVKYWRGRRQDLTSQPSNPRLPDVHSYCSTTTPVNSSQRNPTYSPPTPRTFGLGGPFLWIWKATIYTSFSSTELLT